MTEGRYWHSCSGERRCDYDNLASNAINGNHDYRPNFIFYGIDTERHYGIELEVNSLKSEPSYSARDLLVGVNREKRQFYCKHDGSLRHGFEFNSMPMTLDYYRLFPTDYMNDLFTNAEVFASEDCGFHIHASRADLDYDTIKRIYGSMLNMSLLLMSMSKRKSNMTFDRYASFVSGGSRTGNQNREIYEKMVSANVKSLASSNRYTKFLSKSQLDSMFETLYSSGRYSALNVVGDKTIEFRFFGGTTDWARVMDCLTFVDDLINMCKDGFIATSPLDYIRSTKCEQARAFIVGAHNEMLREIRFANKASDLGLLYNSSMTSGTFVSDRTYRVRFKDLRKGDLIVPRLGTIQASRSVDPSVCFQYAMEVLTSGENYCTVFHTQRNRSGSPTTMNKETVVRDYILLRNAKAFLLPVDYNSKTGRTTHDLLKRDFPNLSKSVCDGFHIEFEYGKVRINTSDCTMIYDTISAIPNAYLRQRATEMLGESVSPPSGLTFVPSQRARPRAWSPRQSNEDHGDPVGAQGVQGVMPVNGLWALPTGWASGEIGVVAPVTTQEPSGNQALRDYIASRAYPDVGREDPSSFSDPEQAQAMRTATEYESTHIDNVRDTIQRARNYRTLIQYRQAYNLAIPATYPSIEAIDNFLRGSYRTPEAPTALWDTPYSDGEDDFGL